MTTLGEADRRAVARYLHALDDRDGRLDAGLATEFERLSPAQFDVLVAAMIEGERAGSGKPAEGTGAAPRRAPVPGPGRRTGRLERLFGPAAEELRTVFKVGGVLLAGAAVVTGFALAAIGVSPGGQMSAEPGLSDQPPAVGETIDPGLPADLSDELWDTGADDWY
ncbi:hypothetical protein MUN74_09445 [Agromyces endophyticus]|uniref:hypothetical protein n=1 Tax=Agromyces sp. H17E-10 TaxID=2932244 RepID=UPI001FD157EA|nr:hypothetical protein [Agromyces sp. H17E-10]UOQ91092.1 hypothetical protein MUN74_09445 [Agromyces sp. H17E-10]